MAKQLVHIGVAVSTVSDGIIRPAGSPPGGMLPGHSNIINISAVCGEAYTFKENVAPQTGGYGTSAYWEKHPEDYAKLKVTPITIAEAMTKFRTWLKQFQGTLIACASPVDFWHLLDAFFRTGRDCPFGSTGLIDAGTVEMMVRGKSRPQPVTDSADPLTVAQARWVAVTRGRMPAFGAVPRKARKKVPTATGLGVEADNLAQTLRNLRAAGDRAAARQVPPPAPTFYTEQMPNPTPPRATRTPRLGDTAPQTLHRWVTNVAIPAVNQPGQLAQDYYPQDRQEDVEF